MNETMYCRFPEYQTFESRVYTFRWWPNDVRICSWQLASLGLFYGGDIKTIQCYYCGLKLYVSNPGQEVQSHYHGFGSGQLDCPHKKTCL